MRSALRSFDYAQDKLMPREPAPGPGRGTPVIVSLVEKNLLDLLTDRFCLFIFGSEQMFTMFVKTESPRVAYCEMV